MPKLDNYRLDLKGKLYKPIMVGGMGVDISSSELALAVAKIGGIGHISDAMGPWVSDRKFKTGFQQAKLKQYKEFMNYDDTSVAKWDPEVVYQASIRHIGSTMDAKQGDGAVFVNVMEKLNMANPKETLRARLRGALDAGADGLTLSAGLHKSTLPLMAEHPRFRDASIGIIVSSVRALKIFLRSSKRVDRLPDYVVVEGPLAGGHLGFGMDWKKFNLMTIMKEVVQFLKDEGLDDKIRVIPAGGVFTGTDAVEHINAGADAIQVATRFTIAKECGLPYDVQQKYVHAQEEDVVVNTISPTGYPMRMLKNSPAMSSNIRPNCESLGYILDGDGKCAYRKAYNETPVDAKGKKLPVTDKMCICYHFMKFTCYTCGHYVYRLKDTTQKIGDNEYYLPSAEHIYNDYMNSVDHQIALPDVDSDGSDSVSSAA